MNKYDQGPDLIIDVHGLTRIEAIDMLADGIQDALDHDWSRVRVITGKGLHSPGGQPVLREAVKHWLHARGYRFSYAKLHDGGDGVIEVKL